MSEPERIIEGEPTCPYCGGAYYSGDCSLKMDGDSQEEECDDCGGRYKLTLCVDYSYISDPIPAPASAPGPEEEPKP